MPQVWGKGQEGAGCLKDSAGILSPPLKGSGALEGKVGRGFPAPHSRRRHPQEAGKCREDPKVQIRGCSAALCLSWGEPECRQTGVPRCCPHTSVPCPGTNATAAVDCPHAGDRQSVSRGSPLFFWGSRHAGRRAAAGGDAAGGDAAGGDAALTPPFPISRARTGAKRRRRMWPPHRPVGQPPVPLVSEPSPPLPVRVRMAAGRGCGSSLPWSQCFCHDTGTPPLRRGVPARPPPAIWDKKCLLT